MPRVSQGQGTDKARVVEHDVDSWSSRLSQKGRDRLIVLNQDYSPHDFDAGGYMLHCACPDGTWETAVALPDGRLRPEVRSYRGFRFALQRRRRRLEVPNASVSMMFGFGPGLRVGSVTGGETASYTSAVTGLRTDAVVGEHDGRMHGVEVILEPWAAYSLFGGVLPELAGVAADPVDILGRRAEYLAESLASAANWEERFALLDTTLLRWARDGRAHARPIVRVWEELRRTAGTASLDALASETGWSRRQFHHHFVQQIGTTPKRAARIHRLERALRLLAAGVSPAHVAQVAGFSDQPHLTREFVAMTGSTPRRFFTDRAGTLGAPWSRDWLRGEVASVATFRDRPDLQG